MAVTDYLAGAGTEDDPYIIHNLAAARQFWLTDIQRAIYVALVADIDMGGTTVVGYYGYSWPGNINGNGFCISNLNFENQSGVPAGVSGKFENLKILNWTGYNNALLNFRGTVDNVEFVSSDFGPSRLFYIYGPTTVLKNCLCSGSYNINEWNGGGNVIDCYYVKGSIAMGTNLIAASDKFDPLHYPGLLNSKWAKDGYSLPRLIKNINPLLSTHLAVKGVTKVGGIPMSRAVSIHSPVDFNMIAKSQSNPYGLYQLICGWYADHVVVVHRDDYGKLFAANFEYSIGDVIHPSIPNGYRYICTTAGTSAATEPTNWPTDGSLTNGAAIFTAQPVYKPETFIAVPVLIDLLTGLPV